MTGEQLTLRREFGQVPDYAGATLVALATFGAVPEPVQHFRPQTMWAAQPEYTPPPAVLAPVPAAVFRLGAQTLPHVVSYPN